MAGPWDKYRPQESQPQPSGPWNKYSQPQTQTAASTRAPVAGETQSGISTITQGQGFDDSGVPVGGANQGQTPGPKLDNYLDEEGDLNTNMYDGMTYDNALKLYEEIINDPRVEMKQGVGARAVNAVGGLFGNSEIMDGTPTFNGYEIPFPEPVSSLSSAAGIARGQPAMATVGRTGLAQEGVMNAPQEIYDIGASAANVGIEAVTGAKDVIPLAEPTWQKGGDILDSLAQNATPLVVGGAGAASGGARLLSRAASQLSNRIANNTATTIEKIIWSSTVGTAGVAGSVAPMNNEEDTLLFDVLSTDPNGSKSAEILTNKANLLADGMATGMAAAGLIKGVTVGGGIVKDRLQGLFRWGSGSQQEKAVFDEIVSNLSTLPANATADQKREFNERLVGLIRRNKEVFVPTTNEGLSEDVAVSLSPLDAIIRGATEEGDNLLSTRAANLRSSVSRNNDIAETQQQSYLRSAEDFETDLVQRGGGVEGMESARAGILRTADEDVGALRSVEAEARNDLGAAREDLKRLLTDDPRLRGDIQRITQETGIPSNRSVQNSTDDEMIDTVIAVEQSQRTEMNRLAQTIPEGIDVSPEYKLLVDEVVENNDANIPANILEVLDTGDFALIHNQALPWISRRIQALKGDSPARSQLVALREGLLGDELNLLEDSFETLDTQAASAAREFRDYARDTYYKNFGQGSLGRIRGDSRGADIQVGRERVFRDNTANELEGLISPNRRNELVTLVEVLDEGGQKDLVYDIIRGRAVRGLNLDKPLDEAQLNTFKQTLGDFRNTLQDNYPEIATDLDSFITVFERNQRNLPELQRIADDALNAANNAEANIRDVELNKFYQRSGTNRREVTDPKIVFQGVFSDEKSNPQDIRTIVDRAARAGPEELEGLRAAFGDFIRFDRATSANKNRKLVEDSIDIVFEDRPETAKAIREFYSILDLSKQGNPNRSTYQDMVTKIEKDARGTLGLILNMTLGPLNRTASRIRSGSTAVMEATSPSERIERFVGELVSGGTELEDLLSTSNKSGIIQNPELLYRMMARAGIYGPEDKGQFQIDLDEATYNLLDGGPSEDDTENALR